MYRIEGPPTEPPAFQGQRLWASVATTFEGSRPLRYFSELSPQNTTGTQTCTASRARPRSRQPFRGSRSTVEQALSIWAGYYLGNLLSRQTDARNFEKCLDRKHVFNILGEL